MKTKFAILFFLLSNIATLFAQSKETAVADKLFTRFEFVDAAVAYLKVLPEAKDAPYIYKQLAECYYNVFNYKEAARWYAKVVETTKDAETYYRYAQMLKADGKYEDSNKWMSKFAAVAPNDQRALEFKQDPNYLPKLRNQVKLYDLKPLKINSDYADFGAVLTSDNYLYFTSARNKSAKKYGWNEEPYLDLYASVRTSDGNYGEPQPVSELNSKFHDGPASITADAKTIYFASESFKEREFVKDKKRNIKEGQVYLFKASKDGDKWVSIKDLSLNDKSFSNGGPSISKDKKTLYFSSNRPGGFGGNDIWKVSIADDGTPGTPENLGNEINSEGNEMFPSITDDNVLFFSSDAPNGFGGLDVFMYDFKKGGAPVNVGIPVNSSKDDFSFSFNTAQNIGYFSSNRDGNDNIFEAIPVCSVTVNTTVKDALTMNVISNAKVAILDQKGNIIETRETEANGTVQYIVDCDRQYSLQISKEGYDPKVIAIDKTKGGSLNLSAELQPIEKLITPEQVVLNNIYFEYNKSNITKEGAFELDKLVQVMKKYPDMVILAKAHTDNRGGDQYNLNLSDRRANATVQYVLSKGISKERISGKGFGESEPKVDCKENCTEEQHAQNRRSEFLIVKK